MSYLTQSYDKLKEELITALEGEGFPYNPNTTSFTEYLSVALGNSSAHLRKSLGKLLSDLDAQYGGSLSELRASIAHLMDDTISNIGAGGGGGGGYQAKAVHFDGATFLTNPSLVATDNSLFSQVVWVKWSGSFQSGQTTSNFYICDAENNFTNETYFVDDVSFVNWLVDASGVPTNSLSINTAAASIPVDQWLPLITSGDVGHAQGSKRGKVYLGRTDITSSLQDSGSSFTLAFNGKSLNIGTDTVNGLIADIADLRIMPGISLLDGTGDIRSDVLDAIMDVNGKPRDPAVLTALLGTAGAVLMSGDAATFGTNQGTGGSFTVTSGTLTNATTSPSD